MNSDKQINKAFTIFRQIDGKILIFLSFVYVVLAIFPEIAVGTFGKKGFLVSTYEARLVFSIMPLVLLAEYFWFSLNNGNKYLTSVVLIAASLIPIFNIFAVP